MPSLSRAAAGAGAAAAAVAVGLLAAAAPASAATALTVYLYQDNNYNKPLLGTASFQPDGEILTVWDRRTDNYPVTAVIRWDGKDRYYDDFDTINGKPNPGSQRIDLSIAEGKTVTLKLCRSGSYCTQTFSTTA